MKKTSIHLRHVFLALVAALAATLAFAMPQTASAAEYGSVGEITQDQATGAVVIPVTVSDALYDAGFTSVYAEVDDTLIANVELAANKTYGPFALSTTSPHVAKLNYTPQPGVTAITYSVDAYNPVTGEKERVINNASYKLPYVVSAKEEAKKVSTATNKVAELGKTGADVAPYALAVILLAGAGVLSLLAMKRTKNNR